MKSHYNVLIVGTIAISSWWLLSTEQEKQNIKTYDSHFINAFINNFTITSTDETGNTTYILRADRLEHYNDEEHSQIINPVIRLPQSDNRWLISAKSGEIDDAQNFISLRDDVTMKQIDTDEVFVITTQAMTIDAKTKIIRSDQIVRIINGSLELESDGMHFDSRLKQLKLLSKVSGRYAPM